MIKLINPVLNGGFPYQNSDFATILQDEQYYVLSSMMMSIRNSTLPVTGNTQTGVIVSGLEILSGATSTTMSLNLTNSLVFLNGQFLKSAITGTTLTGAGILHVQEATIDTETRIFADGLNKNAVQTRTFTINNTIPSSGEYITIKWDEGSSRYINNLQFNNQHSVGDILLVSNISKFKSTGLGFDKYTGWAIADGRNSTLNLADKVVMGYNPSGSTTPTTNPNTSQTNSGAIGNTGGVNTVTLTEGQLPIVSQVNNASLINVQSQVQITTAGNAGSPVNVFAPYVSGTNLLSADPSQSQIQTPTSFGSGQAHENRMPYIVAAYIQKIS